MAILMDGETPEFDRELPNDAAEPVSINNPAPPVDETGIVAAPKDDPLAVDEGVMPGVWSGPSAEQPFWPTGGNSKPGWSEKTYDENERQRLALIDESVAREVLGLDRSKVERAARLARKYRLPESVVTPNLTEFMVKDLAERFGDATPAVRSWIGSSVVNAALGYEDIRNLSEIERNIKTMSGGESLAQDVLEAGKGIPKGAGGIIGTTLQGMGALLETASPELRPFLRELADLDPKNPTAAAELRSRADTALKGKDRFSFNSAMSDVLEGADTGKALLKQMAKPVQETAGFRAGAAVMEGADIFPAAPGFENSIGRQVGEGLGSVVGGVAVSAMTGPVGAGTVFAFSGAGEAAARAVEEMKAGKATDDDVVRAAGLGLIPGLTDSLPIETLLGRIPIPGGRFLKVPAGMLGSAIRGVGRIGWQAFIEGAQEGGQAFLQNLIAREVYKPDQAIMEGVPGEAALGGGVGGIAQVGKEIIGAIAGRKSKGTFKSPEQKAAETAQQSADVLADTMKRVQESPLTKSDPVRMQELVSKIAGQGSNIYMPADEVGRLYQDGVISDATLSQWGVLDQLMEVRRTGGDLVIPTASFLTATIKPEAIAEITRSVRRSAAEPTVREAEVLETDRQARVDELLARMESQEKPDGSFVYENIYSQLVEAGRNAKEAKFLAAYVAEKYTSRAARRGDMTADALYVRDNFKVIGPGLEAGIRKIVKDELDVVIARLQSGREVKTAKTPVIDLLKRRGGVDPSSPLGAEMRNMGITAKSNPGLFKTAGLKAADNIVASEETVLTDNGVEVDENGYASPDALMDGIREEIAGRPWQTQAEKDRIAQLDAPVAELQKIMDQAGFDYRNASPEAIRAFLETQLQPEPVLEGKNETQLDQGAIDLKPGGGGKEFKLGDTTIDYGISSDGSTAEIILVKTPKNKRGQGSARAAMETLLRAFDSAGLTTFLTADPMDKGVSKAKLEAFYKSLGFIENKGRNKDFRAQAGMVRAPQALNQPDGSTGFKRGSFERQRDPHGDIINIIRLTKNANRSTFLHETGHFWYFQLVEDAFDQEIAPEARARLQSDLQVLVDWFGLKIDVKESSFEEVMSATTREHHEQFARGFEAYAMEGKSPSSALKQVMARFSSWLAKIYSKLTALDVELTDDVRGVMDRLLATDEAIEEARNNRMYAVPEGLGEVLTPAERAAIESLAEQASTEARMDLQDRIAREIQREKTEEWKASKVRARETITAAVRRRPAYAAYNLMRDGVNPAGDQVVNEDGSPRQFKIDRKEMVDRYGEEIVKLLPSGIWAKKGEQSIGIDAMAAIAGFDSADALRLALMQVKANPEKAIIKAEVEAELKRLHGDLLSEIDEAAAEAVANDKQMELMALQARYLKRLAGSKMAQAARRQGTQEGAAPLSEGRERISEASTDTDAIERAGLPAEAALQAQVEEEAARQAMSAQAPQRAAQRAAVATVSKLPPVSYDVEVIKQAAIEFVRRRKVKDLGTPERYENEAGRISRKIDKAVAGRDYAAAQTLMEQRLFNLQMAREVRKAQAQVEKAREYLQSFGSKKMRQKIGMADNFAEPSSKVWPDDMLVALARLYATDIADGKTNTEVLAAIKADPTIAPRLDVAANGHLAQIDGLLEMYEFKKTNNAFLARKDALKGWLIMQEASGQTVPAVPQSVMDRIQAISYREVSFGELMDLRAAVKTIAHVALAKNKTMRENEKRTINALVDAAKTNIEKNNKEPPPNFDSSEQSRLDAAGNLVTGTIGLTTKTDTIFAKMDGKEVGGFLSRLIMHPIRRAEIALLKRMRDEAERLEAITKKIYGTAFPGFANKSTKVFVPEIGASFSLEQRIAVFLNWGNESSRQALLDDNKRKEAAARSGGVWNEQSIEAIINTLDKRDLDYAQALWDSFERLRPELGKLHKERTGLEPDWIEAMPVRTRFGTYRGGYYPLDYDPGMASRTQEQDASEALKQSAPGRFAAASTKTGSVIGRVGSGGQSVTLSLSVYHKAIAETLTDVEMGRAITDAWKIINNHRFKETVDKYFGPETNKLLDMWIKDVAGGKIVAGDAVSRINRHLRSGVSVAAMGLSLGTTVIQISGLSQSFVRVGYGHMLVGLTKFSTNPVGAVRNVQSLSPFMQERSRTFQRDVAETMNSARRGGRITNAMAQFWFFFISKAQLLVDYPTWIGGYNRAIKEGLTGQDAVDYADAMVVSAQASSLMSSLSPLERGSASQNMRQNEWVKSATSFYSYFNVKLNLAMQRTNATNFRSPLEVAKLATDYLMIFWVDAAVGGLVLQAARSLLGAEDDDDDEEKTFVETVMHHVGLTAQNAAATIPLFSQIAGSIEGFAPASMANRGTGEIGKGVKAIGLGAWGIGEAIFREDGADDANWWKIARDLIAAGNMVQPFHYPSGTINRIAAAMERQNNGEDVPLADFFLSKPR